jgi:hypothetical protein
VVRVVRAVFDVAAGDLAARVLRLPVSDIARSFGVLASLAQLSRSKRFCLPTLDVEGTLLADPARSVVATLAAPIPLCRAGPWVGETT